MPTEVKPTGAADRAAGATKLSVLTLLRRLWDTSRRGPVMSEPQRFLLLSIVIGIFAGLLVVCFHISMEFLSWSTIHRPDGSGWWLIMLSPALGAAASFVLVMKVFPAARGSGINYTKAALYVSDGYIPFSSVAGKFLASTVSIGSGNPMAPENPALPMGAGVASLLGRLFHLTRDHMRLIAPIGAAAGIGAAFNTPITAGIRHGRSGRGLECGRAGLDRAVGGLGRRRGPWFLGDDPLFRVPAFELTHPSALAVYALIGVVGGILSAWFSRYATRLRGVVKLLPARTRYALPPVAGLLIGAVGVWRPEILGAGYEAIDGALHGHFPWHILILLGLLKMLGSSMCFSAGTPGGMFAPTLFVGAMVGGGLGGLAHLYSPFPTSSAGAYVLVGMGTFFAGVFRAPMTSVFMVFEVSASYVIILPVMIANTVSFLVSRRLQGKSLFHIAAQQDGLNLPSLEEQRESPVLSVEDAMNPGAARVLDADMTLDDGIGRMKEQSWERALLRRGNGNWCRSNAANSSRRRDRARVASPWARPPCRRCPPPSLPRSWSCGSTPICRSTRPCGCSAHTPSCRW